MKIGNKHVATKSDIVELTKDVSRHITNDPHCIVASNACRLLASLDGIKGYSNSEKLLVHKGFVQLLKSNQEMNRVRFLSGYTNKPVSCSMGLGVTVNAMTVARQLALDGLNKIDCIVRPNEDESYFKDCYKIFKIPKADNRAFHNAVVLVDKRMKAQKRHHKLKKIIDFFWVAKTRF